MFPSTFKNIQYFVLSLNQIRTSTCFSTVFSTSPMYGYYMSETIYNCHHLYNYHVYIYLCNYHIHYDCLLIYLDLTDHGRASTVCPWAGSWTPTLGHGEWTPSQRLC